nr:HI0074 family nucleotidyltransferase substrate-binding subunit [uncultured Mediterraneibacter sp.]
MLYHKAEIYEESESQLTVQAVVLSKSWESFQRSLDALAEARHRDMSDSFVLSGTSAKFSITFDLSWKVMKDLLIQHYAITDFVAESPIEVLGKAYNADLISDDIWMEMLKIRNQLAHDYDGVIVKEYCQKIIGEYIDHLYAFKEHVVTLLGGRCVENQET